MKESVIATKAVLVQEFTTALVRKKQKWLFVFGDNDLRKGRGGQACIRYAGKNVIGIRTKKAPSRNRSAYWTDDEIVQNMRKIDKDIDLIKEASEKYERIAFALGGYGTGLALLPSKAPKTFAYLNEKLSELYEYLRK